MIQHVQWELLQNNTFTLHTLAQLPASKAADIDPGHQKVYQQPINDKFLFSDSTLPTI